MTNRPVLSKPSAPFWADSIFPPNSVLFILGTDTAIGKTRLTETMIRTSDDPDHLFVIKAVQTGAGEERDLDRYLDAGLPPLQAWEGESFLHPLDPMTAASLEKRSVDLDGQIRKIEAMHRKGFRVIVEGSGGILSPFFPDGSGILLLIKRLSCPVTIFLVSHPHLGTLSATLSAVRILKDENLPLSAVILCPRDGVNDEATRFNPQTLGRLLSPLPVLSFSD